MRARFISILTFLSKPVVAIGGALVIAILLVWYAWHSAFMTPSGVMVPAVNGSITQEVDVTGIVQAAHSIDLSFQSSGRVAAIQVVVGSHVGAGQVLVALDSSSQAAATALARANLASQQAKLAAIEAGTRPEQVAILETNVAQAQNALASAFMTAYTNADDAVHAKADQLFTNPRNSGAQLAILVPDATLVNRIQAERVTLEPVLSSWRTAIAAGTSVDDTLMQMSETNLKTIASFLDDLTTALAETQSGGSLSQVALTGYQSSVNTGRLNVSGNLSAIIGADTAYTSATGALTLAQAGATQNDVNAQKSAVDAAEAQVAAAQAAASQAVIVAPVSGVITAQNADLGETVVPGVPLVSMIADGKYQAVAHFSETDIAKVKTGDTAEVTFSAYPDVPFAAVVTTVDPAATMTNGSASYGVTITFASNDTRLLPGLSANVRIITAVKSDALVVPTSAIITDGTQKFVYVTRAGAVIRVPVTTGIESANGMTEIVSGLSAGDSVRTFGSPTN